MTDPYGGIDMARVMYGDNARHVPCWMYVQDQAPGIVSFVGSSKTADSAGHLLRYDRQWDHNFIVGEIIVRPHVVIGTSALRGESLGSLATRGHYISEMLDHGELIAGSEEMLRRLRVEGRSYHA